MGVLTFLILRIVPAARCKTTRIFSRTFGENRLESQKLQGRTELRLTRTASLDSFL